MNNDRLPMIVSAVLFAALAAVAFFALKADAPEPARAEVVPPAAPPPAVHEPEPAPAPAPAPTPAPAAMVKLQVLTLPPGAEVFYDERALGRSPLEAQVEKDVGTHKIVLKRPGSEPTELDVVPDQDRVVKLQLSKHKNLRVPRH